MFHSSEFLLDPAPSVAEHLDPRRVFAEMDTDRKINPGPPAQRFMKPPLSRYIALAQRRTMVLMSRRGPLLLITGILRPPRHPLRVDAGVANRSAPAHPASRGRLVCRRALPRGVRETAPSAPDRPRLARAAA